MARLIVKSPYIKCGGGQGADGYMRYIATRERVEIIPDDRPPTRKQEQLITKLTKDFPDVKELLEYDDYVQKPTKANASSLITLALEEHWKQVQQTTGCSVTRIMWIWMQPCRSWSNTLATSGRTLSLCIEKTWSVSVTTTHRHGELCSVLTATTSRQLCTSRPRTSGGTRRSTMRVTIHMST